MSVVLVEAGAGYARGDALAEGGSPAQKALERDGLASRYSPPTQTHRRRLPDGAWNAGDARVSPTSATGAIEFTRARRHEAKAASPCDGLAKERAGEDRPASSANI